MNHLVEKVKILISISEDFNKIFRGFIAEKHQKYEKGLLSYEVEQAMRHWYALHTKAQTSLMKSPPNPTPRIAMVYADIKHYLSNTYYEEMHTGMTVPHSHIKEAIVNVRGNDRRTIRKWFRTFEKMKVIKRLGANAWEMM